MPFSRDSNPAHWSRDFVEHLRTVHFALITVCAGLLVILWSKPYDTVQAASQMSTVSRLVASWPLTDLPHHTWYASEGGIPLTSRLAATVQELDTAPPIASDYLVSLPASGLYLCPPEGHRGPFGLEAMAEARPATLQDFIFFWDSLRNGPLLLVNPLALAPEYTYKDKRKNGQKRRLVRLSLPQPNLRNQFWQLTAAAAGPCHSASDVSMSFMPDRVSAPHLPYGFELPVVGIEAATISQEYTSHGFVIRASEETELFAYVGRSFADSFPDLAVAAAGRLNEDISKLDTQLSSDSTKGTDAFEAFGMKFPAEQVTRYGILLLLAVQLYFFAYLQQFYNKLKPDDPGWDTPWIVMSQTWLSQNLSALTIVFLPTATSISIMIKAFSFRMGLAPYDGVIQTVKTWLYIYWEHRFELSLAVIGFIASFLLAGLTWNCRPRVDTQQARSTHPEQ